MIPSTMKEIGEELANYLDVKYSLLEELFFAQFPMCNIHDWVEIIPKDRKCWNYRINGEQKTCLIEEYVSRDGARIWMGYSRDTRTFYIRDDGYLWDYLRSVFEEESSL